MAIVYQHRKPGEQLPFYIGIGKTKKRAYETNREYNDLWMNIVKKYGYEVDILIEDCTYKEAREIEIYLIRYYGRRDLGLGPLANMTDGGDGLRNPSEKARKKMSIRNTGENNPFFGKKHTPEHIEKNRRINIGKKYTAEINKKKGSPGDKNPMYGRTGDKNPQAKALVVEYISGEIKVFGSIKQASDYLDIHNLSGILSGRRKIYKRFIKMGIIDIRYKDAS